MRWTLLAASAAIAATLWLPGEAAQPGAPTAATAADAPITFEQYRDWRVNFNERRRGELAAQLAATDLPAAQRARLEGIKAYYDRLAGLPDAERDRSFRERFERIDTNHDGQIDQAERATWRDKQRAFYRHDRVVAQQPAAAATP
jgi:hypothetical protein